MFEGISYQNDFILSAQKSLTCCSLALPQAQVSHTTPGSVLGLKGERVWGVAVGGARVSGVERTVKRV